MKNELRKFLCKKYKVFLVVNWFQSVRMSYHQFKSKYFSFSASFRDKVDINVKKVSDIVFVNSPLLAPSAGLRINIILSREASENSKECSFDSLK